MTSTSGSRNLVLAVVLPFVLLSCNGQKNGLHPPVTTPSQRNRLVGGGCDGCELMFVGMPATIPAIDTSVGWTEAGQKLLITGTVYKLDGRTPAPDVVIYYWQTDNNGLYSPRAGMDESVKRHGHIRGWIKTDGQGKYALYTVRPAPYPNETMPAHIHLSVKEPDIKNEYYIDEFVFDDDKLLTGAKRKALENRGGSGILRVVIQDSVQIAEHNIILGLHIPNYPRKINGTLQRSGLQIGEDQPSFSPYHAYGPDKGTRTCPVCKYGRYQGILYFVGDHPDWTDVKAWLRFLDRESVSRRKYLKVYFVYGNKTNYHKKACELQLEKLGTELGLKNTALTFIPSYDDRESEVYLNKINPEVENTFILYRNCAIVEKFVDLKHTEANCRMVSSVLDKTQSPYRYLPEPWHD